MAENILENLKKLSLSPERLNKLTAEQKARVLSRLERILERVEFARKLKQKNDWN